MPRSVGWHDLMAEFESSFRYETMQVGHHSLCIEIFVIEE
jgi:hypothetical protein